MVFENTACSSGLTGRCLTLGVAGYWLRQEWCRQFFAGRMGRGEKPPPQLGQTLLNTLSTQALQNVHSNVQIMASVAFGASGALQFSQVGRSSSN